MVTLGATPCISLMAAGVIPVTTIFLFCARAPVVVERLKAKTSIRRFIAVLLSEAIPRFSEFTSCFANASDYKRNKYLKDPKTRRNARNLSQAAGHGFSRVPSFQAQEFYPSDACANTTH